MLRRLAVLLSLGGFGISLVHANSIVCRTLPSRLIVRSAVHRSHPLLRAARPPEQNPASEFWELQNRVPAGLLRSIPAATSEWAGEFFSSSVASLEDVSATRCARQQVRVRAGSRKSVGRQNGFALVVRVALDRSELKQSV